MFSVLHWLCLIYVSDRMAEIITNELDVKDFKITSTEVEDTCFVNIPDDEIKLENTEIQGKLKSFIFNKMNLATCWFMFKGLGGGGGGRKYPS